MNRLAMRRISDDWLASASNHIIRSVLPPLFSLFIPLIIIRVWGLQTWGNALESLLFLQFCTIISAWGSREYLSKRFAVAPKKLAVAWTENLIMRGGLLLIFLGFAITSPFGNELIGGFVCSLLGRFLHQSVEPIIHFQKRVWVGFFAGIVGFTVSFAVLFGVYNQRVDTGTLVLSLGIGDLVRGVILSIWYYPPFFKVRQIQWSIDHFYDAFPYFFVAFTGFARLSVDRYYVYLNFEPTDRAIYQVFQNHLMFLSALPALVLFPVLKRYYKDKARIQAQASRAVFISLLAILPLGLLFTWASCTYIFQVPIQPSFLGYAALIVAPAFVYTGYIQGILADNFYYRLATVYFICSLMNFVGCAYFVPTEGLQGALKGAAMSSMLLIPLSIFTYYTGKK